MPIIEVDHVTKAFQLGELEGLKVTLRNQWRRLRGLPTEHRPPFKALDDVSFSLEPGEVLGIIGHNGAGKSTLLKLLAGISKPTTGRITTRGVVAPLIEVGAGFVGQLTGRENVYLNGAILGMSKSDIARKFDEIVDFAEIEEFIDTPVKRYSSGMRVKLAFSVATSIKAEILIVDEVLAVGDLAFQRKCFDRMESLIKSEGRTVLLVSHNIRQVERLCGRVIVMDHGRVAVDDLPQAACNHFYLMSDKQIAENVRKAASEAPAAKRPGEELELREAMLLDRDGKCTETVTYGGACTLRLRFFTPRRVRDLGVGVGVHTPDLLYLAADDMVLSPLGPQLVEPGEFVVEYRLDKFMLLPGNYSFRVGAAEAATDLGLFYAENLCHFQVLPGKLSQTRLAAQGFFMLNGSWSMVAPDPLAAVCKADDSAELPAA